MSAQDLVGIARGHGIELWLKSDGNLGYAAPRGALSDDFRQALTRNKERIIQSLRTESGVYPRPARCPECDSSNCEETGRLIFRCYDEDKSIALPLP